MRMIVRVGVIAGSAGFVALFVLQTVVALAVAGFLVVVGLAAGLGMAKWLERPWYGRQFMAGLRAGALAVSIAAVGAVISLLAVGPRTTTQLASHSHVAGFTLASWVKSLSVLSWAGIGILTVTLAALVSVAVAALTTQVFAWSKNRHAIHVVTQARQAAQSMSRDTQVSVSDNSSFEKSAYYTGAPVMSGGSVAAMQESLTSATLPSAVQNTSAHGGVTGGRRRTLAPAPPTPPTGVSGVRRATITPRGTPGQVDAAPTVPVLPATPTEAQQVGRVPSKARKADRQLTEAMRDALATWAKDNEVEDVPGERSAPQPSSYLNSSPPIPKRGRKKQDTRDWLC